MKKLSLFLVAVAFIFSSLIAKGDSQPAGTPLFTIPTTNDYWPVNSKPGDEMTTRGPLGGSYWKTIAFIHTFEHYGLLCGIREVPYTATITNESPLSEEIGIVSIYLAYNNDYRDYLNSVSLWISSNEDFSDYQEVTIPNQEASACYWNFYISQPAKNKYYQIRVDFQAKENNWIEIDRIDFYGKSSDVGVQDVFEEKESDTEWYNLQGVKIENPHNGLFIRKCGSKITKVIKD